MKVLTFIDSKTLIPSSFNDLIKIFMIISLKLKEKKSLTKRTIMLSISIRKNDSSSLLEMILSGKSYDLPGVGRLTT